MNEALRIVARMGVLHRLFFLFVFGVVLFFTSYSPWLFLALAYGVVTQFFVEYAMHRFIYHREPPTEQSPFNALYRAHIGHHEFPAEPEFFTGGDNWFAVRFALISVVAHTLVLRPFFGLHWAFVASTTALFIGSIAAFTFYEYCHTLAHINVPKGWFGQRVTRRHMAHHYQDHEATFHVSFGMGWIDRLFGTDHDPKVARERYDRETILSMGMDPHDLRLVTARKAWNLPDRPGAKRKDATT